MRLPDRDVTRDGVGEGAGVLEFALEEAPAGLAVVGEGPAAPIGKAGSLAGLQVDVLAGLQVAAKIVDAFHHHQLAPGGFARLGGEGLDQGPEWGQQSQEEGREKLAP
jgi:hypothetical protein